MHLPTNMAGLHMKLHVYVYAPAHRLRPMSGGSAAGAALPMWDKSLAITWMDVS